jgi:hypothetical protein
MKKKMDEERDEQRVHRQLRELQEDFIRENNPNIRQSNYRRDPSPLPSEHLSKGGP